MFPAVTSARQASFQFPVGIKLAAVIAVFAVAGCSNSGGGTSHHSPSPSALASESPTASPTESPTPAASPSPSPLASPAIVPSWAAMHASCSGGPAAQEALVTMQGSTQPALADVTDPLHPRTICTITGSWTPQLVSQQMISWSATQGSPGTPGSSVIATLDMFTGTSALAASWTGGGERVVSTFGAVPGRGVNPNEDDAFIGFSPDGAYFAFEQSFSMIRGPL